ncbi:MAG TPA: response regulator transcription factor, partial [Blastocatellia bacterium]|nr:response regulator transcription factor [Blastocatellia bacterium]
HDAIARGGMGLVRKLEAAEVLLKAIRKIFAGEVWLDGALMARLLTDLWQGRNVPSTEEGQPHETAPGKAKHKSLKSLGSYVYEPPAEEAIKIAQLTDREREVIALVGEGLRNQQIADRLFISVITVRHHLSSIFSKLEVEDRFELAIYAYRYGLAPLPM